MKRLVALILVLAAVGATGLVLAVTGTDGARGSGTHGSAVAVRSTLLGHMLVDAKGRTLYLFEADKPNMSACSGGCASIWPPFTATAKPPATDGAVAAKIATIPSGGGKRQVTYAGHPLYTYAGDQHPGATTGQGLDQFGAEWYVLAPTGHKIDRG